MSDATVPSRNAGGRARHLRKVTPLGCILLSACFNLGQLKLEEDQLGYSRAVSESERQQALLNIVRMRYGEAPTFLDVTQVIAGYQRQRTVTGGFEVFPSAPPGTYLTGAASAQLQESPTFTFQSVAGDHYAQNFLRPLSPAELLPLAQGNLPIDVLLGLAAQSVGGLRNATGLGMNGGAGSPSFFVLLRELRALQVGGLLGIRLKNKFTLKEKDAAREPAKVYLTLAPAEDQSLAASEETVRRLFKVVPSVTDLEVVYGRTADKGQLALLTRPMLGVLGELAFQVDVPPGDVAAGRTCASPLTSSIEGRTAVIIHSAHAKPAGAFAAIAYGGSWFWIDDGDFDSKLAFSILSILLSLAETSSSPGTVITIPSG